MIHSWRQGSVGPHTQVDSRNVKYVNRLDQVKVVDFIFKYRTLSQLIFFVHLSYFCLDQLIAMGVAPPPQPENKRKAVENDDEVIIVSDDEVKV